MSFRNKKILVCPLDWGLGHAARDVPIISRLSEMGHEVIIAGDGAALELLRTEFPALTAIRFETGLRIRYSLYLPAWLKITLLSPFLLFEIFAEHYRLAGIIKKTAPDIVISDNRYGLWNRRVRSILITHQLSIRLPGYLRFFEYPASLVLRAFISKFDRCWIPDFSDASEFSGAADLSGAPDFSGTSNLSGELSHRYKLPGNAVFIGAISRFSGIHHRADHRRLSGLNPSPEGSDSGRSSGLNPSPEGQYTIGPVDLLILLSGPEPQRSRLEKIILKQVFSLKAKCVILQGIPGKENRKDLTSTVTMYSHLPARELQNLLLRAGLVICRSGYTGIMDLALMNKKALIIPTPGQTEQEYLSKHLAGKGMFLTCDQDELDLESAIRDLSGFNPVFNLPADELLDAELDRI